MSDPLLEPYQLKHLTLRNRIMSTAHEPNYAEDGLPTERYRLYHVEKAKGGIALTMTAGSAVVSRDSPPAFGNLLAYKDEIVAPLRELAEQCHEHGAAVMIQLTHLGRRTNWNKGDWLPVVAPSMVREPAHRAFPKEIEDWDMARIVGDYASAAARMKEAGLDGLELECYGHLIDGFWSPATNRRGDDYGGDLENRMRFGLDVYRAMREEVGPGFLLGLRMALDEDWNRGFGTDVGFAIAKRFIDSGLIDFLNVIRGHIDTDAALSEVIPIHGMAASPHLDFAGRIRRELGFPVFHAARIGDVATARHAIAEGKLDMVGMTRAHMADPHIAKKVMEGRENEIRPCVGATYCLDRIYEGHEALCIHNAATGRESTMPHVLRKSEERPKKIVVVGAGPAGLEAARVCGERGHKVTLFEASEQPGGQLRLAARAKRRAELIGIADWRMSQIERQDVTPRFGLFAEASDILAEEPEIVVIATGGYPNSPELQAGQDLAVSSWDILSGDVRPGENVLLYDDNGAHPGMQAAEIIAEAGSKLELISPERFFAPEMGGLNHVPYARLFAERGVRVTINTRLAAIRRDGNSLLATLCSDYAEGWQDERRVDQIVVEHATIALDELYFELKAGSSNQGEVDYEALVAGRRQEAVRNPSGGYRLFRIGDCVASRNIHAAIYDALRLCKDF